MGYVTNDPKKGDEQQPGASGLVVDLGLMVCPQCRREVPDWQDACTACAVPAVPRSSLAPVLPDIPAHLLADDDDADGTETWADGTETDDDADDTGADGTWTDEIEPDTGG